MKTKRISLALIAIFLAIISSAQETFEVNGYILIHQNGELYNINGNDTLKVIEDVITIKFKSGTTTPQIEQIENEFSLEKLFCAPTGWIDYKLSSSPGLISTVQTLKNNISIYKILINRHIPYYAHPNESNWTIVDSIDELCELHYGNPPYNVSHLLMRVDSAWEITAGSPDIVIAFLDSGINLGHEDLGFGQDNYHNLWINPLEIPGNNLDDDGNGYIDDIYGWNFINNNASVVDNGGHGTLVSGNAVAKTNNGIGTFGIAGGWGCQGSRVMTIKIGDQNGIYEPYLDDALYYAIQNGVRIVNMSFGDYNFYNQAFDYALNIAFSDYNCVLIAAAGNKGNIYSTDIAWPASHEKVIGIGATAPKCEDYLNSAALERRWFGIKESSSCGASLDFVATCTTYFIDNQVYTFNDTKTSGATANASGIAALVLSANPYLSNHEVIQILKNTADKIDYGNEAQYDWNGHSLCYGYGRINAYKAVIAALAASSEPAIEITGVVTWSSPRHQSGNVVIKSGGQLTLTSTLIMRQDTKIVVERGGKLIVDGGKITAATTNHPWQGIEVWGNSTLSQLPPSNQGWVRVINHGSINNSKMGIYANRSAAEPENDSDWEPGYTGGIVQATQASLVNNVNAVQLFDYDKHNYSFFTDCKFINHGHLVGCAADEALVKLIDVTGVTFMGCRFINNSGSFHREGILGINAAFRVTGLCLDEFDPCENWKYSSFEGLIKGIHTMSSGNPQRFPDIQYSEFTKNYRGLYLGAITNARVTSNRFMINTPFVQDGGYGIYLDNCKGYWVEGNDFSHEGSTVQGVGLVINHSGIEPNEIYRNRFSLLETGISVQGVNRNASTGEGLQLRCNVFDECSADLLVANPQQTSGHGIASSQGATSANPLHIAGNLFHIEGPLPDGDFDDINNEGGHITYYFPINNEDERVKPIDYTQNTVTRVGVTVNELWTYEAGCPCRLGSELPGEEEMLLQQMAESSQQADETQEMLAMLIDGGDTPDLQWDVYMSTFPEAMQVYGKLMSTSPYLSDTVVSTAIFKETVLPAAMLRDVLVANPHTAKSGVLMEKLDQRWMPMPDYMKAQVLQGKSVVSVREQAESRLSRHKLSKANAVNSLARLHRTNADSLTWLWENDNSLSSKYNLAFMLLEQGMADQGQAVLNTIPEQFDLTDNQLVHHQQFVVYYNLLETLQQSEKGFMAPDNTQVQSLVAIEAQQAGLASVYAKNILLASKRMEYNEPVLLPDLMKSRAMLRQHQALSQAERPTHLRIFPNPARMYLFAEYHLPATEPAVIEFTDTHGRVIHRVNVKQSQDQVLVDTRNWEAGLYVASLKAKAATIESIKFVTTD